MEATNQSLKNYAHKLLIGLEDTLTRSITTAVLVLTLGGTKKEKERARQVVIENTPFEYYDDYEPRGKTLGTPNREFIKDYYSKITARVEQLTKTEPIDPDTRSSLHARAERQIRYEAKQDEIEALRRQTDLILVSTHADCSERCFRWQGRVYSLNHTSGKTSDGRSFVPLETATNIPYVTKKGKIWFNGLFGFNCRHYAVAYKPGREFPTETEEERADEYAITETLRALERGIRKWANSVAAWKGISRRKYFNALRKYSSEYSKYEAFCKKHNRPVEMERLTFFE